ncbi:MAG: methyltransferase [Cyanosarcina radialis HA8281-LM2]|jgi:SAM-dependent methyltransferase|nr:methyltransferase [Cyanosarcina radialis HA8281-LM2]
MSATKPEMPLPEVLMQMISGKWVTQAIYAAAKLGIADLLEDGAKSSEELAGSTQVDPQSLYRLLRALSSVGIFHEGENRQFTLTPLAEFLRSDHPHSMKASAIWIGGEPVHWQPWGEILYSVKTGQPAFDRVFGMPVFPYFNQNPEAAAIFDAAMTGFSKLFNPAIVPAYNFSSINTLVDVGGGHGSFLAAILKANPHLKGIVYDLPQVIAGIDRHLSEAGLGERCQAIAGSFFDSVPSGGDAYIMKTIIHDWSDEKAIAILKNCHRVLPANGKVLVVDNVIGSPNDPSIAKFLDLEMLLMTTGGRERTETEFRDLFAAAGFQLTRIVPTQCPLSIVEGVRE